MRGIFNLVAVALAMLGMAGAAAGQERFDPSAWQRRLVGEPTQILVLGTPHLSGTPEDWNPATLEPLLERLARFQPDVITIEALPGPSIASLWRDRAIFGDTGASYGGRILTVAAAAQVATGLDLAEAEAEARRRMAALLAQPAPAERRRLAALFAAAGDPNSALVQWWRLEPAERRAEDGVSAALLALLDDYARRRNENHLVGSRLAARLGLERVHAVDAQDDDIFSAAQAEAFGRTVFEPMSARFRADPRVQPLLEANRHLGTGEELLATYRQLNRREIGQAQAELEWRSMLDRTWPDDLGRIRLAGWEVRNLRMAANIRQAASNAPGGRVLVIVGAGHKQWLESYLAMMADVRIVEAGPLLR